MRRRENPYPSREEKKILAVDTGEVPNHRQTLSYEFLNKYLQASPTLRYVIGLPTGDES